MWDESLCGSVSIKYFQHSNDWALILHIDMLTPIDIISVF